MLIFLRLTRAEENAAEVAGSFPHDALGRRERMTAMFAFAKRLEHLAIVTCKALTRGFDDDLERRTLALVLDFTEGGQYRVQRIVVELLIILEREHRSCAQMRVGGSKRTVLDEHVVIIRLRLYSRVGEYRKYLLLQTNRACGLGPAT